MAYLIDNLAKEKTNIKIKSLTDNEKKVCGEFIKYQTISKPKKENFTKRLSDAFNVLTGNLIAVYFIEDNKKIDNQRKELFNLNKAYSKIVTKLYS